MTNNILQYSGNNPQSPFDSIRRYNEGGKEFWLATELLSMLGYKSKKRQLETVERAILSCVNQGLDKLDHFSEVVQMTQIGGSAAERAVLADYRLTRFACYLTAMNGDPRKPEIALAQLYFATKTREAEGLAPRQIPPVRDAIQYLEAAKEIQDFPDPLMRSLLNQRLMEDLGAKSLPASAVATQVILTVRASELGYPQSRIGSGSQLGTFVARLINPIGKTQHGRYSVNVFDLTQELDDAIHAFFR
jgi:hypothetical protein